MNINDPFGRMQARREREYRSLCQSLRESGLTERREAEQLKETMRRRARQGLAIIVPVALVLALLLPEQRILVVLVGGLLVLWLVKTSRRGQQYVERYIREELEEARSEAPPPRDDRHQD